MNILCKLGLHKWEFSLNRKLKNKIRCYQRCKRCGKYGRLLAIVTGKISKVGDYEKLLEIKLDDNKGKPITQFLEERGYKSMADMLKGNK